MFECIKKFFSKEAQPSPPQSDLEKLFWKEVDKGVEINDNLLVSFRVGRLSIYTLGRTVEVFSDGEYLGELPSKYCTLLYTKLRQQQEARQQLTIKKMLEGEGHEQHKTVQAR